MTSSASFIVTTVALRMTRDDIGLSGYRAIGLSGYQIGPSDRLRAWSRPLRHWGTKRIVIDVSMMTRLVTSRIGRTVKSIPRADEPTGHLERSPAVAIRWPDGPMFRFDGPLSRSDDP